MTVAHVTGAARGIGKAIALRLAQDGHNVAVSDLPAMRDDWRSHARMSSRTACGRSP